MLLYQQLTVLCSVMLLRGVLWSWSCSVTTGLANCLWPHLRTSHQGSHQTSHQSRSSQPSLDWWRISKSDNIQRTHPTSHLTRLTIIAIRIAEFLHKKNLKITNIFCWLVLYEVNYGDITGYKHRTAGVLTRSQDEHFLSISPRTIMVNCGAKRENDF